MKTLKEITIDINTARAEIDVIRNSDLSIDKATRKENKEISKIKIYEKARNYIELSPTKESILSQKDFAEKQIAIYDKKYHEWLELDEKRKKISNPKEVFNEQCEIDLAQIKKWKTEIKFLNYILS